MHDKIAVTVIFKRYSYLDYTL